MAAYSQVDLEAIHAAVHHPERWDSDRERDSSTRPADVLAFLGIAPSMSVLDLDSATGYFAELLSRLVGPGGHVIAHAHPGPILEQQADTLTRRYGGDRLPNTERLWARHNEIELPPNSLDAVLMSMVYHDTYWLDPNVDWGPVDHQAMLASLHRALKPGAVIGVIDHHAPPGSDPWETARTLHRIDPAIVRRDFEKAGFVLEAESELLRTTDDDYSLGVFDPAVHGRTDRFLMRFVLP